MRSLHSTRCFVRFIRSCLVVSYFRPRKITTLDSDSRNGERPLGASRSSFDGKKARRGSPPHMPRSSRRRYQSPPGRPHYPPLALGAPPYPPPPPPPCFPPPPELLGPVQELEPWRSDTGIHEDLRREDRDNEIEIDADSVRGTKTTDEPGRLPKRRRKYIL